MSFSKFYVIVLTAFLFLSSLSDAACPKTCNCAPIPQQNFPGECCKPGSLQYNDTDVPSFCTDKPFESGYTMKIDEKVPVQINLVDYCTDQIIFSSFVAPQVDRFSVANFPCSFQPASCSEVPTADQASCQAGEKVWTDTLGCTSLDVQKLLNSRICNSTNYPGKTGDYVWVDANPGDRVILPTVGYCNCNWKKRFSELNGTGLTNVTKGVPNGYIKEGMSTFYVQVMIGGRSTSANDDPTCQCASPWDVSPECMCALGTRKVPYIYNYSYLPSLTALISIQNGQLIYQNTYVRYNFEERGIGCVGCSVDYCWGVPMAGVDSTVSVEDPTQEPPTLNFLWRRMGFDLTLSSSKQCAIRRLPDPNNANAAYCRYPTAGTEVDVCSLKIYIAWIGTDGYGQPCQSSNEMFSKFTQMGVSNIAAQMYTGASSLATKVDRRVTG
ncbi:hypothetical protein GUITHDRAFT_164658 [Guillardia theta CCMP2712]|uniref:Uncharacterized protein n=1 Tax=Guillardia theta (strain CCMP2712) TaxID=905079 RepID=L1IVZ2_GUITC|nr:hypothetical protein GUITHDRAFT_164658 [Guillardia theta CCMP2712]EKX40401.1 hypothetical protein GUITHDRAFT_164658 [Guillardia theta CCMP2712]|eukprot:XP_005827381.1 hypothetical protein GUITHDRAFT_164658 [Guillardia theta CCMP2712]